MSAADPRASDDNATDTAAPAAPAAEVTPTEQQPAAEADASAAPTAEAPAEAPESVPAEASAAESENPVEIALQALAWCREHPTDDTAVETLNTVFLLKDDPAIKRELLDTCRLVGTAVAALPDPPATLHAHMTVLLANLLGLSTGTAVVDGLYAAWVRNPKSFGRGHLIPPRFQLEAFVQRLGDLLGWGSLDIKADREALVRWAEWFDSWNLRNKFRARRSFDTLRRAFFAPEIWKRVHFEEEGGQHRGHGQHGQHGHKGGGQRHQEAAPQGDGNVAVPVAEGEAAPGEGGGEAAPGDVAAPAGVTGDANPANRKKRRRRRKRKPGDANNPGASAEGGAESGNAADDDGGDDGGDDSESNGNVAAPPPAPASEG